MNKMSVKLRVTLWYTVILAAISIIALAATASISIELINRDTETRIKNVTEQMVREVERSRDVQKIPPFKFYEQGVHMSLYDEKYNLLSGQQPFGISEQFEFKDKSTRKESYNGSNYYVMDRTVNCFNGKTYWIKSFISISDASYAMGQTVRNSAVLVFIMIALAAAGGYFIIGHALEPVRKITETAENIIRSSDLSKRIELGEGGDEIHYLAAVFDDMLDKIEKNVESEKQFTSDASHELRTPVAVIISECEYMIDCAKSLDEMKESAYSVKAQAEKMSKLISELLAISRMDKNTMKTSFENLDLSELLGFVCDEQEQIHNGEVVLKRNIESGIFVEADRFLIARMFINLISNAYTYGGGEIKVSAKVSNGFTEVSVEDNGIGISKENLLKIWDRFYQVDPSRTSNENGNMGLGLSMVKLISKLHGGEISVRSELGKGSIFKYKMKAAA